MLRVSSLEVWRLAENHHGSYKTDESRVKNEERKIGDLSEFPLVSDERQHKRMIQQLLTSACVHLKRGSNAMTSSFDFVCGAIIEVPGL